jgi:hypothetical protein
MANTSRHATIPQKWMYILRVYECHRDAMPLQVGDTVRVVGFLPPEMKFDKNIGTVIRVISDMSVAVTLPGARFENWEGMNSERIAKYGKVAFHLDNKDVELIRKMPCPFE